MKKIFTIACSLLAFGTAHAQDIHFSQFYETSILRNPALMGTFTGDYKVAAVYRSQWGSISNPFQTGLVTGEVRLPVKGESGDYFTAGLLAFYDKAGTSELQTVGIYPAISFTKYLGGGTRSFLTGGFTGGYLQRSFNPDKMTFNTQYVPGGGPLNPSGENLTNNRISNWDVGAGISLTSATEDDRLTYYAGIGGYHFNRPKRSFFDGNEFVRLDIKWCINAGFTYRLTDQYGVQVHTNYNRQGVYNEFILGGLLGWKRITNNEADATLALYGGVFYRFADAAIPTLKVDYKRISVTASYDVTTSKLNPANNGDGGFEITLIYTGLFADEKYERSRTICPKPW